MTGRLRHLPGVITDLTGALALWLLCVLSGRRKRKPVPVAEQDKPSVFSRLTSTQMREWQQMQEANPDLAVLGKTISAYYVSSEGEGQ